MRVKALLLVLLSVALPTSADEGPGRAPAKRRNPEPSDFAALRAKAFHDIYAGKEEAKALRDAIRAFYEQRDRSHPVLRGRPLAINFPSRPLDERLKLLTERVPTRKYPGATFRMRASALPISGTSWHNLGPTNFAGRVSALAVDPTNSSLIYRGTAGGGLWKSTDGGTSWAPLTDSLGNLSIGAVAVAPSNPQILYVGTGEGALGIDGIDGIGRASCRERV